MEADRIKWNRRFASEESYLGRRASPFLQREIERILALVPGRRALDVACGEGRNSIFLAQHGFSVTGLDISEVGLEKGRLRAEELDLTIDLQRVDLEEQPPTGEYDLIINFNFLLRYLIGREYDLLAPGGLILFDTILASPELLASHNAEYLLLPGELHRIFSSLEGEILFSEESSEGEMPTARVFFRKSAAPKPSPVCHSSKDCYPCTD